MDGFLNRVIDRTISDTERLMHLGDLDWGVARRAVLFMIGDLSRSYPCSSGQIKEAFEAFIVRNDKANAVAASEEGGLFVKLVDRDSKVSLVPARRHERRKPTQIEGAVRINSKTFAAKVLNVSASGVGVETSIKPEIGSTIRVGDKEVTVVRHFDAGFGAKFLSEIEPESFDGGADISNSDD